MVFCGFFFFWGGGEGFVFVLFLFLLGGFLFVCLFAFSTIVSVSVVAPYFFRPGRSKNCIVTV